MVSEGGVALAYPKVTPQGTRSEQIDGTPYFDTSVQLPVLQELNMYRRESTTDVTIPDPFNTAGDNEDEFVTLVDLPRENYGPEGQRVLDDYLKKIGRTPYERLLINRAEFSGYLPELREQGMVEDILSIPQQLAIGVFNNAITGGYHSAMAEFSLYATPQERAKIEQTGEQLPQIPYAPSFAEELAYRLGITEDQALALQSYDKDALTRGSRIAKETATILLGFYGGRNLMDKKRVDQFVEFTRQELDVDDVKDIPNAMLTAGKSIDHYVHKFVSTKIKSIIPGQFATSVKRRSVIRGLQRAERANAKWRGVDRKQALLYAKKDLEKASDDLRKIESQLSDFGDPRDLPAGSAKRSAYEATKRQQDALQRKAKKLAEKGISSLVPESIKLLAGAEFSAVVGAALFGQYSQDVINAGQSGGTLSKNAVYAEALGAVSVPLLSATAASLGVRGVEYAFDNIARLFNAFDPNLERLTSTGDRTLDKQLNNLYSAIKRANPAYNYLLDQFDRMREIRLFLQKQ